MVARIEKYLDEISKLVLKIPSEVVDRIASVIFEAYKSGNRIFVFGNGGGSSTSAHFVCDRSTANLLQN